MTKKILLTILSLFIGIQFVPVDRSEVKDTADALVFSDVRVQDIVKKSCYDCHSYETKWPWYSYVAPISWQIASHVEMGRKEINFSIFEKYTLKRKIKKLEELFEEVEEGKMPLPGYILLHANAKLNDADKSVFLSWAKKEKERYIVQRDSLK